MLSLNNEYIVLLDACVLAPMPLCDTLLRLAEDPGFFIPRWSPDILAEVESTLTRFGRTPEQVSRRITAMNAAFADAMVEGYQCLIGSMTNDPKDRHVLAAAVRAGAHAIVSDNVKHFPSPALRPYDLECLSADEFLVHQYHLEPELLCEKLEAQAASLPGFTVERLVRLLSQRTPEFARLILSGDAH